MLRLLPFAVLALLAFPARGQDASGDVPPPWEVRQEQEGDGPLSAYSRLLETEAAWIESDEWRDAYLQTLAQMDAGLGRHASALAMWDRSMGRRGDSVAVLGAGVRAVDAALYIAERAEAERVVMINEAHHDASTRLLTLRLLPLLYERGYRYFAAETFAPEIDSSVTARGYPASGDGYYSDEPVFGEMIREAVRLGYTLVPYEIENEPENDTLDYQQRRDLTQAEYLRDRVFARAPDARVLVHAGFGHIEEEVGPRFYPMAVYFREITGIDPLTVDQVRNGGGERRDVRGADATGGRRRGTLGDAPGTLARRQRRASGAGRLRRRPPDPLARVAAPAPVSAAPRVDRPSARRSPVVVLGRRHGRRRQRSTSASAVLGGSAPFTNATAPTQSPAWRPARRGGTIPARTRLHRLYSASQRQAAVAQILDGETGVVLLEHALSDD